MRMLAFTTFSLALCACTVPADEIIRQDGKTILAEVYRETEQHVYYIDPAKDCCSTIARKDVKEIKHSSEPLVDIKAFLARAEKKLSFSQRADLQNVLKTQELYKEDKRPGIKIVVHGDPHAPELVVDPFPGEDDNAPPLKGSPAPEKKPAPELAPAPAPAPVSEEKAPQKPKPEEHLAQPAVPEED